MRGVDDVSLIQAISLKCRIHCIFGTNWFSNRVLTCSKFSINWLSSNHLESRCPPDLLLIKHKPPNQFNSHWIVIGATDFTIHFLFNFLVPSAFLNVCLCKESLFVLYILAGRLNVVELKDIYICSFWTLTSTLGHAFQPESTYEVCEGPIEDRVCCLMPSWNLSNTSLIVSGVSAGHIAARRCWMKFWQLFSKRLSCTYNS